MARARDYKAEYARRIAREAARVGKAPSQLTTAERKQARGHARTEGHGFRVRRLAENPDATIPTNRPEEWIVGASYLQPGEHSYSPASDRYGGAAVPTPSEVARALANVHGRTIFVRIQVIGAGEGSAPADTIQWLSSIQDRESFARLIDDARRGEPRSRDANKALMADLASTALAGEPVAAALAWGFSER